ncbi:OsmC family protein [Niabella ginsengisoli]|uniref:OsmC family protein n=1 Tax=Niabella ginsengisoli TaxID=522298 RepID=A0ABS9SJW8_9BACT|nr:OsmC family protein [Niabella ginsengisoli]MCH5598611.1 OsmC family protein [Niabella ginsengisoli]
MKNLNMTSDVIYNGELRTTCTHLKSGSNFETDAPVDNNGKGERFSPTDLLATSLATCMITVMGIKARTMNFDLDGVRIEVLKKMAAEPRRVSGIDLKVHIPEKLTSIDAKTITILKNTGNTCPVAKSLHPDIEITTDWGAWS